MKATELAWAAGFFDGEGCTWGLVADRSKRRGKGGLRLIVSQSGNEAPILLQRFQQAIGGHGHIDPTRKWKGPGQQPWRWRTNCRSTCCLIMQYLWPYLGPVKRRQFIAAMEKVKNGSSVER